MTATLFPVGFGEIEVRLGNGRPSHAVYVRRRLLVGLLAVLVGALALVGARSVLADRGGVPASTPAIRPASAVAQPAAAPAVAASAPAGASHGPTASVYIVQAGDTLWSLAEAGHGKASVSDYVEQLIDANGGTTLQIGQQLVLP